MRVDNIQKFVSELVEVVKTNVELPSTDKDYVKNEIRDSIIAAFKDADFAGLIRQEIKLAMKDVTVVNPILVDKEIIDARIVTETRESQEVNDKMKSLNDKLNGLIKQVEELNYDEKIDKAIKAATKNTTITNAIIKDVDVTHCNIIKEDVNVPRIKEVLDIRKKPVEVEMPEFRKTVHYLNELYESKNGERIF